MASASQVSSRCLTDLQVTDVALLDGGNTVLVDSATGPVQLQLRGTDAPAPGDASAAAVLFAGVGEFVSCIVIGVSVEKSWKILSFCLLFSELNMRYAGENGGQ